METLEAMEEAKRVRMHVRFAVTVLVVVLLLGAWVSVALAQDPYPPCMVPGCPTDSLSALTGQSWYFTYSSGAPGYDPYYMPGTLGYGYDGACSSLYGYAYGCCAGQNGAGYWYGEALSGGTPCPPASPKTTQPAIPVEPLLPSAPQLVYPTPVPPQLVYPTPEPPQPEVAPETCSSTEPCPPPKPQYATMAWGTFGTYEFWAHKFRQEHCCCPTDKDVAEFWASQTYFEQTGETPFSGGFCWQ